MSIVMVWKKNSMLKYLSNVSLWFMVGRQSPFLKGRSVFSFPTPNQYEGMCLLLFRVVC